jgi:hypothetical protein
MNANSDDSQIQQRSDCVELTLVKMKKNNTGLLIRRIKRRQLLITLMRWVILISAIIYLFTIFYRIKAELGREYFNDISTTIRLTSAQFILFALMFGFVFFSWKNGKNQFWYGIFETFGSSIYCYFLLNERGFLPEFYWLTTFYFSARGIQNIHDGLAKKFKYKTEFLRLTITILKMVKNVDYYFQVKKIKL